MSGLLQHSPADIVRRLLISKGAGSNPDLSPLLDWPIYATAEPSDPDNVITVYNTAGRMDGRSHPDGSYEVHEGIQMRVRAGTNPVAWKKISALTTVMDEDVERDSVTIDGVTYCVHSLSRTSTILDLNKNIPNSKRSLYTVNYLVCLRVFA